MLVCFRGLLCDIPTDTNTHTHTYKHVQSVFCVCAAKIETIEKSVGKEEGKSPCSCFSRMKNYTIFPSVYFDVFVFHTNTEAELLTRIETIEIEKN